MAKSMAKWGSRKFVINTKKANPISSFSTSSEAKASDSKSKKKKTEIETVTFTEACHSAAGVDPMKEYYTWRGEIGNANQLYIGGSQFKSNPLKLKKVSLSNVKMDDIGRVRYADIALTFEEKNQKEKKTTGSRSTASKSDKSKKKKSKTKKK